MKIVTVVGARPQFIKAATVSREIRRRAAAGSPSVREILVHTGQHCDDNMSKVFFDEMDIPRPDHHLGIAGLGHGAMTGRMLEAIEQVLLAERPDWLLVYGDTNSTLAGALAAVKLHIPVAHVEAGLRSFNNRMPEEINRIVADRVSAVLFCPTAAAVENLRREGAAAEIIACGDVMYDAALHYRTTAAKSVSIDRWGVSTGRYALCTVHRAENTDDPARLGGILEALATIASELPIVFPIHPRTRKIVERTGGLSKIDGLHLVEPVSYLEMIALEANARAILTDSGGVQKEAFFHGVPCITMRDETEWVETVTLGWNALCGAEPQRILSALHAIDTMARLDARPYGDGRAAAAIVDRIEQHP
jgi:UDP-GlcNAc3NAcA epimerase